jgi:hypothetical protein
MHRPTSRFIPKPSEVESFVVMRADVLTMIGDWHAAASLMFDANAAAPLDEGTAKRE